MRDAGQRVWLDGEYVVIVERWNASEEMQARAWSPGTARWNIERALDDRRSMANAALLRLAEELEHGHAPPSLWATDRSVGAAFTGGGSFAGGLSRWRRNEVWRPPTLRGPPADGYLFPHGHS